jgi:hypothetical protein
MVAREMSLRDALARIEAATHEIRLQIASEEQERPEEVPSDLPLASSDEALACAKRLSRARRRRDAALPEAADLFRDPAWDLLLDLFISGEERGEVSITSVCIGATVPGSTGLRHLTMLHERGLVSIRPDPDDRRRRYIRLQHHVRDRLIRYFSGPEFRRGTSMSTMLEPVATGQEYA